MRFKYKARSSTGQIVERFMDATSEDAVDRQLASDGMTLLVCEQAEVQTSFFPSGGSSIRLSQSDLIFFTVELKTSYAAGLPLLHTLEDMATSSATRDLRAISKGLAERVRSGTTFADALSGFPKAFPALYVELVAAAEKTGKMDAVLADLVKFLKWQKDMRTQIVAATIYPASLMGAVVLLGLILVLFVFPRLAPMFGNGPLPLPTEILIGIDHVVRGHFFIFSFFIAAAVFAYLSARNLPAFRWRIDLFKLRAPIIGPLMTKILMSRFAHNLSMMLASGLEYGAALRLCERLMQNAVLAQLVAEARIGIQQGRTLSDAMSKGNLVPSLVKRMLKLGETTGEMDKSLEEISKYYDEEIPAAIKKMFQILEPLILVFMAGVVLFMAAAVLMPIYGKIDDISKGTP